MANAATHIETKCEAVSILQLLSIYISAFLRRPCRSSTHKSYQIKYQIYFTLWTFLGCFLCFGCVCVFFFFFFHRIARGRRPSVILTLTQAKAPTRARLCRAFWRNGEKNVRTTSKIEIHLVLYSAFIEVCRLLFVFFVFVFLLNRIARGRRPNVVVSSDQAKFPKTCYFGKKKLGTLPKKTKLSIAKHWHLASFFLIFGKFCHYNALRFYSNPSQQQQGANGTPTLSME